MDKEVLDLIRLIAKRQEDNSRAIARIEARIEVLARENILAYMTKISEKIQELFDTYAKIDIALDKLKILEKNKTQTTTDPLGIEPNLEPLPPELAHLYGQKNEEDGSEEADKMQEEIDALMLKAKAYQAAIDDLMGSIDPNDKLLHEALSSDPQSKKETSETIGAIKAMLDEQKREIEEGLVAINENVLHGDKNVRTTNKNLLNLGDAISKHSATDRERYHQIMGMLDAIMGKISSVESRTHAIDREVGSVKSAVSYIPKEFY